MPLTFPSNLLFSKVGVKDLQHLKRTPEIRIILLPLRFRNSDRIAVSEFSFLKNIVRNALITGLYSTFLTNSMEKS
jgi:hypothetical protein